jgi:phytanoyl-CoA hydroxylase
MLPTAPELDLQRLKETFDRDGFAVAPALFSPGEVDEIRQNFERLRREKAPSFYEDGIRDANDPLFQFPRLVHPHRFDENARRYMLHPRVIECLRRLFDEEPVAVQSMYYFKPPGARGQAMHQDNLYLLVEPGTCIAAWTALDYVDRQNGGMLLVPGTNKGNLLCQESADLTQSFSTGVTRVPAGMKAVDVAMNDPRLDGKPFRSGFDDLISAKARLESRMDNKAELPGLFLIDQGGRQVTPIIQEFIA